MRIYQKKNVSPEDETALFHLDRRHTLKEETDATDSDDLRKATRAISLGDFEGHSSTNTEVDTSKKQKKCTRKQTVITESELSSSLLYKDRKAKINSNDESIEDATTTVQPENQEDLEPRVLHDPELTPVPVSNQRSRKMSSCCWYFTMFLVICVACLAIIASIGGIVYMELFATKEITDAETFAKMNENPVVSKEIIRQPAYKQDNLDKHEPKIPEHILRDFIKNSSKFSLDNDVSTVIATTSQPKEDTLHNKDLANSNRKNEKDVYKVKSKFVSENRSFKMSKHPKTATNPDMSSHTLGWIDSFNTSASDKSALLKRNDNNLDLSNLRLNFQRHIIDKILDEISVQGDKIKSKGEDIVEEKSSSVAEVSDSNEENFQPVKNFISDKMIPFQAFESTAKKSISDTSFQNLPKLKQTKHSVPLLNGSSFINVTSPIDDKTEENSFSERKLSIDRDPTDNVFDTVLFFDNSLKNKSLSDAQHSLDDKPEVSFDLVKNSLEHSTKHNSSDLIEETRNLNLNNSLDLVKNANNSPFSGSSLNTSEHFIDHSSEVNSLNPSEPLTDNADNYFKKHNQDSRNLENFDDSPERRSTVNNQNISDDSSQLVFIRPIVESKAIPVPLAFLRRIGFDIKNPNSHEPMSAKDMDIKFSLSEALKYLRSLDTDNKLPTSREKTASRKTNNQKENAKTITLETINVENENTVTQKIIEKESKKMKLPLVVEREDYLNTLRKQFFQKNL